MTIDHMRAIRRPSYLAKKRARLQVASQTSGAPTVDVLHEGDGSCCRREPWAFTLARLVGSLVASHAGRESAGIEALITEHEPAFIVASPKGRA